MSQSSDFSSQFNPFTPFKNINQCSTLWGCTVCIRKLCCSVLYCTLLVQ